VTFPFGQGFERAEIFPKPGRDALQAVMLFNARPPGRLEMLSLVGGGG